MQRELLALMEAIETAKTLVAHDVRRAKTLAGRAVFSKKGRIVDDGRLEYIILKRGR